MLRPEVPCPSCRRGLAHIRCNTLLGMAGDDPARLRRIAANLAKAKRRIRPLLPAQPVLFTMHAEPPAPPRRPNPNGHREDPDPGQWEAMTLVTSDPVHALRARLAGAPPGVHAYLLARQAIAAQMIDGAATEGDRVTDLGPLPPWAPDPGPAGYITSAPAARTAGGSISPRAAGGSHAP